MTDSNQATPAVVWVAGVGASAGLGAAVARRFARAGFTAAVSGRTVARLESVADEIRKAGGVAHALACDVTQEAEVTAAVERVKGIGALEVAVFNAGTMAVAPSLELRTQDFEQTLKINLVAGFTFAREALRVMLPRGRGTLLFTGATGALRGKPPFAAFAAAKAGLRSLSQTLAREFGPSGIHVAHVVIDGVIDGERVRSFAPDYLDRLGPDGALSPDAIADVYLHLHQQARSTWTQELDLRPYKETF